MIALPTHSFCIIKCVHKSFYNCDIDYKFRLQHVILTHCEKWHIISCVHISLRKLRAKCRKEEEEEDAAVRCILRKWKRLKGVGFSWSQEGEGILRKLKDLCLNYIILLVTL